MSPQLQIQIIHGSILQTDADGIVNAANSLGLMGGGVAGVIKRAAGPEVEEEARRHAPIPVGHAVATSGGRTRFKMIVHAPTMARPAMRIDAAQVAMATQAALAESDARGLRSIAIPGMGTGVGSVPCAEAAWHMLREITGFESRALQTVILVDVDPVMVNAWRQQLQAIRDRPLASGQNHNA